MNLKLSPKVTHELKKNAPTILSVFGVAGIFVTGILGIRAGMKAEKIRDGEEMALKEFLAKTWRCYILVSISALISSGFVILGNRISMKQIAALSGLAAAGGKKFNEYRAKIREMVGDEKEKEIFEEAKKASQIEWIDNADFMKDIEESGVELEKPVLYYDDISDRFFEISPTRFLAAKYHLNKKFWFYGYVTLNEWYELLGVEPVTIRNFGVDGDNIAWTYDNMIGNDATSIEIFTDSPEFWHKRELPEDCKVIRYEWWPSDTDGTPWEPDN